MIKKMADNPMKYTEKEFQKKSLQKHKLKAQENFTPFSQKLEEKNLLVTPKNYLQELFGVINCGIL